MGIVEQMRSFESDHEPDGWPAIQMKQVSALCDEIERLRSIIDTANQSPRITEHDALPAGYKEEWKRNVMLMWSCVRKHDSSIPSDVLDYMREQLLDKLNEAKHD